MYVFGGGISVAKGVQFPATNFQASDANTLDDYEEGTWTPSLRFGGGSTGMTYSIREGYYTRIGRLVYATFYILLTAKGSSTGNADISGYPFSASNTSFAKGGTGICSYYTNLAAGVVDWPAIRVEKGNTISYLWLVGAGTSGLSTDTSYGNSSGLIGSVCYETDS